MTTHTPRIEGGSVIPYDLRVTLHEVATGLETPYIHQHNALSGPTVRQEFLVDESGTPGAHEKYCSHYLNGAMCFRAIRRSYRLKAAEPDPGLFWWVVDAGANLEWYWPSTSVLGSLAAPYGTNSVYGLPMLFVQDYNGFRTVRDPEDLDDLRIRGLRAMLPDIKPDVSILNALFELKDFRRVGKLVTKAQTLLGLLRKKGPLGRKTLKRAVSGAAELHLTNQFAVQPFISDVFAVFEAIRGTRNQLKQLLARRGLPQRHHFECALGDSYTDRKDVYPYDIPVLYSPVLVVQGEWWNERRCRYQHAKFNMTLDYSYDVVGGEAALTEVNVLLDRLGLNVNPQIIWNAIPYSFVLDWLVGVNAWLGQFARRNVELRTVIEDCSWSVNVDRTIECWINSGVGDIGFTSQAIASRVHEKAYKRVPYRPDLKSSIEASGLSVREATLLGSLLAVRWK